MQPQCITQLRMFNLSIRELSTLPNCIMAASIPVIFHSLKSVMDILNDDKYRNLEVVKKLIITYDYTFSKYNDLKGKNKKYPFIVFEGLDATGKSTISRNIARKYNATLLVTPPKSIAEIRPLFEGHCLRTAYYSLGNYIGEMEVFGALQKGPVILDRYWYSTAAYALAQSVHDNQTNSLPPKSDKLYEWPSDLLKPDAIILLTTTEEARRLRLARRRNITDQEKLLKTSEQFRANIVRAYENMNGPKIEFVDSNGTIQETVNNTVQKINYLF